MSRSIHGKRDYQLYIWCIIWCISCVLFSVRAESSIRFFDGDEALRKNPWQTYQTILNRSIADVQNLSEQDNLLYLLRKAQSEHLLNYFTKFRATMAEAALLVNDTTPNAILCRFNIYSGIAARINSKYTLSESFLNKALEQAKAEGLHRMRVFAKQEMAYTHAIHELYDVSLKDLQEAYVAAFALHDDYLIAIINETYGAIHGYMDNIELSIEYYQKARNGYERLGYPAHVSNTLFGLASSYRYTKQFDEAIQYFEQYLEKSLYTPEMKPSYYGLYGISMTLAEKGDCDLALTKIDTALSLQGIDDYDAELYKSQARCFIQLDRIADSETALKNASLIFDKIPEVKGTKWHVELIKIQSEIEFAKGNKGAAYELLNQYYEAFIEIVQSNASSKLIKTQAMMGIEQRNVELTLLQQRDKVQNLLLEQKNQQNTLLIYLVVFGICLILIIFGALFFQRNYSKKLLTLSITDSLTGLYNRHYIFDYLAKIIDGSDSSKNSVSVIILDIDNFKQVNDTYGHPFGDHVIKVLSALTQEVLRIEDVMGRIGGEEFFCVLPRTTTQQAVEIAQRIVKTSYSHEFVTSDGECVNISVSVGIASSATDSCDADLLYSRADEALYESKRLGKNRVSVFQVDTTKQQESIPLL